MFILDGGLHGNWVIPSSVAIFLSFSLSFLCATIKTPEEGQCKDLLQQRCGKVAIQHVPNSSRKSPDPLLAMVRPGLLRLDGRTHFHFVKTPCARDWAGAISQAQQQQRQLEPHPLTHLELGAATHGLK